MSGVPRWSVLLALTALLLAGCTGGTTPTTSSTQPTPTPTPTSSPAPVARPPVPALASLACEGSIDGGPAPAGWQTVLGVVALPTSPASPALQASVDTERMPVDA